jgi:hypothetical protein
LVVILAIEAVVAIIVLAIAWWPASDDTQSPVSFGDGLELAFGVCLFALAPVALFAAALHVQRPTVRAAAAVVLGVASGIVAFAGAALAAAARIDDGHEA